MLCLYSLSNFLTKLNTLNIISILRYILNPQTIINKIKASASTVVLKNTPVSASLRVALNGVAVKRGLLNGFNYMQSANSLVFYGMFSWPVGSTLTVTYSRWK